MMEKRAYFTPSPERAGELVSGLLFGDPKERLPIEFSVETESSEPPLMEGVPNLEDISLIPEIICASEVGITIFGRRDSISGVIAKLSINTTVEPPLAIYSQTVEG